MTADARLLSALGRCLERLEKGGRARPGLRGGADGGAVRDDPPLSYGPLSSDRRSTCGCGWTLPCQWFGQLDDSRLVTGVTALGRASGSACKGERDKQGDEDRVGRRRRGVDAGGPPHRECHSTVALHPGDCKRPAAGKGRGRRSTGGPAARDGRGHTAKRARTQAASTAGPRQDGCGKKGESTAAAHGCRAGWRGRGVLDGSHHVTGKTTDRRAA
jgi:hypothetical protein